MKFGGASLSTAHGMLKACQIVKEYWVKQRVVLVVSAMKGVTDRLFEVATLLENKQIKKLSLLLMKLKKLI